MVCRRPPIKLALLCRAGESNVARGRWCAPLIWIEVGIIVLSRQREGSSPSDEGRRNFFFFSKPKRSGSTAAAAHPDGRVEIGKKQAIISSTPMALWDAQMKKKGNMKRVSCLLFLLEVWHGVSGYTAAFFVVVSLSHRE